MSFVKNRKKKQPKITQKLDDDISNKFKISQNHNQKNLTDSVASWTSTPRKRQPAAAMFAPILILTKKKLWWNPISNGEKPNENKNNKQEKPNRKK